ncbi:putative membrane protein insertion efficiency factor [Oxalobacteraceae bacterium GrIS 2.11]
MTSLFLFLVRAYQLTISPYLGQNCRFYPSCSAYADIAIRRHGVVKGALLSGRRLCKCHPWHEGGVDLVPELEINTGQPCDIPPQTRLKLARSSTGDLRNSAMNHSIPVSAPPSNQPHFTTD